MSPVVVAVSQLTRTVAMQDLAASRHPFIVSLLYSFQDQLHLYLVMEFVGGGDLFALIGQQERFPEEWVRIYMAEIALALEHVHAEKIIYRDLKPENVMVAMDGHLKLTDFGFAKRMQKGAVTCGSRVGTPEYMAPELLEGKEYSYAVDWWTLGCLGYEMLTGVSPFRGDDIKTLVIQITCGDVRLPGYLSPEAESAVSKLMARDPEERLGTTAEEGGSVVSSTANIKAHPFFLSLDFEALLRREIAAPYKPVQIGSGGAQGAIASEHGQRLHDEFGATWQSPVLKAKTPSLLRASDLACEFWDRRMDANDDIQREATIWAGDIADQPPRPSGRQRSSSRSHGSSPLPRKSGSISPNPMLGQSSSNLSLSLELTSMGTIWRASNPLAELLGKPRGQVGQTSPPPPPS